MYNLLSNVRIVEGASFIAAPYCALMLSQLGAEVIRFDPIGGGPDFHRWPITPEGNSLYWEGLNKGKKSVALNLSAPEGRDLAVALATAPGENGGIFVTNFPNTGFLSHERLCARRSDMLTARVMGKADGSSAVDYTVNCAVGLPFMTGPVEAPDVPVNHVLPAWDLLAGSTAAVALLAAIEHRRRSGLGQEIHMPLTDIAAATLGTLGQIAEVSLSGQDRPKGGNSLFGAFGRDFAAADGKRFMVVALTAKQWESLIKALDISFSIEKLEQKLDVSFKTDEGNRFRHKDQLDLVVASAIARLSSKEVASRFEASGVCFGPYRTLKEAVEDDPSFASANPVFSDVTHPSGRTYRTPGYPASFGAMERRPPTAAPMLGQHTQEVLSKVLSLPDYAISDLHERGVVQIGCGPN